MGLKYKNIELKWLGHSAFAIKFDGKTIYIDPYRIIGEDYEVEKADCLNGAEHTYKRCGRVPLVIHDKLPIECPVCGERKSIHYLDGGKYGFNMDRVLSSKKDWDECHAKKEV
jgi:hypothetical protein